MEEKDHTEVSGIGELVPAVDGFAESREEYIRALELTVRHLSGEVESLRQKQPQETYSRQSVGVPAGEMNHLFAESKTYDDIINVLNERFDKKLEIIESAIFLFTDDKKLAPFVKGASASVLSEPVLSFEEKGICDWAMEKNEPVLVPAPDPDNSLAPGFAIVPMKIRGLSAGIYFFGTTSKKEILNKYSTELKSASDAAAIALDNLRSADEILRINRKLSALNKQMISSSRLASVGQLAGTVAGEIENPLNVINANLDLIAAGVGDQERRIQIIREQINKINRITDGLKELTRYTPDKKNETDTDLALLIQEAVMFTDAQLKREGIIVETEVESQKHIVHGHKAQLEHALMTVMLFQKATMPEGGKIRLGLNNDGSLALITITDNGIGMERDTLASIFDPLLFESELPANIPYALFPIKSIIEQHGGEIKAISELGKGTTFKITLPLFKK